MKFIFNNIALPAAALAASALTSLASAQPMANPNPDIYPAEASQVSCDHGDGSVSDCGLAAGDSEVRLNEGRIAVSWLAVTGLPWVSPSGMSIPALYDISFRIRRTSSTSPILRAYTVDDVGTATVWKEFTLDGSDWQNIPIKNVVLENSVSAGNSRFNTVKLELINGADNAKVQVADLTVTKVIPYSFQIIHLEPETAVGGQGQIKESNINAFKNDVVGDADNWNLQLTIMLSPQWLGPLRLGMAPWIAEGHEFGVHHHGPSHGESSWDGYTLDPVKTCQLRQEYGWVDGTADCSELVSTDTFEWQDYAGFWSDLHAALADAYDLLNDGAESDPVFIRSSTSTDKWWDYPSILNNAGYMLEVSSGFDGKAANTGKSMAVYKQRFGPGPQIDTYKFLNAGDINTCGSGACTLEDYVREYSMLPEDAMYGFTFHGHEYDADIQAWFEFLYNLDNDGGKRLTLGQLWDHHIWPNGLIQGDGAIPDGVDPDPLDIEGIAERCGNTVCDRLEYETTIINSQANADRYCPVDCGDDQIAICEQPNGRGGLRASARTDCEKGSNISLHNIFPVPNPEELPH